MIIGTTHGRKQDTGKTILIYGPPGVGKSVLASYLPKPFFVDCEGGLESVLGKHPVARMESWADMMSILAALNNAKDGKFSLSGVEYESKTIIVDTIDETYRLIMAGVMTAANREIPRFDEWNLASNRCRNTLRGFRHLKEKGFNVVFTSHEEYEKSDLTSIVVGQPNIPGQLPQEICSWMDIVFHMTTATTLQGPQRVVQTQPTGVFYAKDRTWTYERSETIPNITGNNGTALEAFWDRALKTKEVVTDGHQS